MTSSTSRIAPDARFTMFAQWLREYADAAEIDSMMGGLDDIAMAREIAAALESLAATPVQPAREWIPVGERLPTDDRPVLFWSSKWDADFTQPGFGYKRDDDSTVWLDLANVDRDGDACETVGVTHWMPLPPPPAADK